MKPLLKCDYGTTVYWSGSWLSPVYSFIIDKMIQQRGFLGWLFETAVQQVPPHNSFLQFRNFASKYLSDSFLKITKEPASSIKIMHFPI